MRCSDQSGISGSWLLKAAVFCALLGLSGAACAHKSSDSYLQIQAAPHQLQVRWDIALRDLDVALDLDADGDGKLTWAEIKSAWPRIESYARDRLQIVGCDLHANGRSLERRNDGAYAAMTLTSDCTLTASPTIRYSLFADVDPTHRGIAKIERPDGPMTLLVLVPSRLASSADAGGTDDAVQISAPPPSRWAFLREGIRHIVTGYDHVLFLLCLLLPAVMRRTPAGWRPVTRLADALLPVIGIVSAFTVAHSITLALAALKLVSLSPRFVEPAIAVTIMLAALDNVWPVFPVRRVFVAFFFGLIHGFGFASVLGELNLQTADFAWALFQFNLGIEMGQLMIVGVTTLALFSLRDWSQYRLWVIRVGSMTAMSIAALWFVERTANLSLLPF